MPPGNKFRHQVYRPDRRTSPYQLLPKVLPTKPSSDDYADTLRRAGQAFGEAGVLAVYCVHGTFAGTDAMGLFTELARVAPGLSRSLSRLGKQTFNLIAGESGNYTNRFAREFQQFISEGAGKEVPVHLFCWSSQNNHIGRADGAVRLLCELAEVAEKAAEDRNGSPTLPRVILWGHSHGGNVFSLLTNLLGKDEEKRQEFFEATRTFYRSWLSDSIDMPDWEQAQEVLSEPDHPVRQLQVDIVTFGTPVQYGWDADGYANLLNFINHQPPPGGKEHLAPVPLKIIPMFRGIDGDYVQQIGIAGSNFIPVPLFVRTLQADLRLNKFLKDGLDSESIFKRLKAGTRVPDEGTTLLVDYQESAFQPRLMGHAAYTRRCWLPFHCREVATRLYGAEI